MSITKVAKLAGVSTSTVSRVLNNHPRVAPQTVRTVRRAMEQLNYAPSDRRPGPKPARQHHGGTRIALLVFDDSPHRSSSNFAELLRGVSQAAAHHGVTLAYHQLADAEQLPSFFLDQRLDGVLLHGLQPSPAIRERLQRLPTVWLMGNRQRSNWGDRVMPDLYELGEQAARYLLDREHQRLALFNLDAGHWALHWCSTAFMAAARNTATPVEVIEYSREPSGGFRPAVDEAVLRFLALKPRPTGLCVVDSMQTALLQPALQKAGIVIGPGHCEVVTCNHEESYLLGLHPRPMTFDTRVAAVGRRGVELLLWRLEHRNEPERVTCAIEPIALTAPLEGAAVGAGV